MARRLALSWLLSEGWQYLIPPQTQQRYLCSSAETKCCTSTLNNAVKLVLYLIFAVFFVPSSKCTGILRNNQHQSHPDYCCLVLRGTTARYLTSLIKSLKIQRIYAKYLPQYLPTVPQQESLGAVIKKSLYPHFQVVQPWYFLVKYYNLEDDRTVPVTALQYCCHHYNYYTFEIACCNLNHSLANHFSPVLF